MKKIQSLLKTHVFVCTNKKANGECCDLKGASELRKELKVWTDTHPEWKKRIRINQSGCLDHCSEGIAIAIYPQNEFLTNVNADDISILKDKITQLMNQ